MPPRVLALARGSVACGRALGKLRAPLHFSQWAHQAHIEAIAWRQASYL